MSSIAFKKVHEEAFTLTDLLAVILIFGVLGMLLLPALASTKPNSAAFQCLQNQRQLVRAWQMYAGDNSGVLVASLGQNGTSFYNARPVWMTGNFTSGVGSESDTNVDIVKSPLWIYVGKNAAVFKCPADLSTVSIAGVLHPRVRSFSMSQVFDFGSWLPSAAYGGRWRTYAKTADIVKPANTFVFIDESPKFLNDAGFATDCNGLPGSGTSGPQIIDLPAINHNNAASLSFADGHAEMHRWHGNLILNATGSSVSTPGDLDDFIYLAENTTVLQ